MKRVPWCSQLLGNFRWGCLCAHRAVMVWVRVECVRISTRVVVGRRHVNNTPTASDHQPSYPPSPDFLPVENKHRRILSKRGARRPDLSTFLATSRKGYSRPVDDSQSTFVSCIVSCVRTLREQTNADAYGSVIQPISRSTATGSR